MQRTNQIDAREEEMKTCYIDGRRNARPFIFDMEPVTVNDVRLRNVETGRTTIVGRQDFNRNYEPIRW